MKDNKRWKTQEEAKSFITKCFDEGNFGLSYCSACEFVGLVPNEYKSQAKGSYLGMTDDCFINLSNAQLKAIISELEDEVYTAEYVESHKFKECDEYLASAAEVLQVAKDQLKWRHSYEYKQLLKRYKVYKTHRRTSKNRKRK